MGIKIGSPLKGVNPYYDRKGNETKKSSRFTFVYPKNQNFDCIPTETIIFSTYTLIGHVFKTSVPLFFYFLCINFDWNFFPSFYRDLDYSII